jgi:hypothetical protein
MSARTGLHSSYFFCIKATSGPCNWSDCGFVITNVWLSGLSFSKHDEDFEEVFAVFGGRGSVLRIA